jgi:hypothetical protein
VSLKRGKGKEKSWDLFGKGKGTVEELVEEHKV